MLHTGVVLHGLETDLVTLLGLWIYHHYIRHINGRFAFNDAAGLAAQVTAAGWPFYVELREKWRDWGDRVGGQREFLVQDPDGYLVMLAQRVGERPLPSD